VAESWADYPQTLFDAFKAKTGITVSYQQFGGDEYEKAVKTRLAGGGNIDILGVRAEMRKELFGSDLLLDLAGKPLLANVKDNSAATAPDGKIYGIVLGTFCEGVWYNKDLFSKQKIAVPKNWKEFNDACAKLKAAGITPLVGSFKDNWVNYYAGIGPIQRIYENDPKMVQKLTSGAVKWTDKIWIDALKEVEAFLKRGYFAPESTGLGYVQGEQAFIQGKAAMFIMGTWSAKDDERDDGPCRAAGRRDRVPPEPEVGKRRPDVLDVQRLLADRDPFGDRLLPAAQTGLLRGQALLPAADRHPAAGRRGRRRLSRKRPAPSSDRGAGSGTGRSGRHGVVAPAEKDLRRRQRRRKGGKSRRESLEGAEYLPVRPFGQ
jgi:ABC-type glycerol-3-phosphate transport system substrate-binding protein